MKRLTLLLLLLALSFALGACPAPDEPPAPRGVYTLVPADAVLSSLSCTETGVTYKRAEFGEFLPGALSQKAYATAKTEAGATLSFYKIKDAEPEKHLFQADDDLYPTYLLYEASLSLPTLSDMAVSEILICDASAEYFWRDANVIDRIRLYDRVDAIVTAYESGEKLSERPAGAVVRRVELIFVSEAYAFDAVLGLEQLEDGTILLSCARGTVAVSANLFDGYQLEWEQ